MAPSSRFAGTRHKKNIRATVDVLTETYEDVPFGELLHHPAATTRRLDAVRALRLRLRDAGDLALMRYDRHRS